MTKQNPDDVKRELEEQDDEFYGDETVSGSNPEPDSDDSVEEMMSDVVGEDFDETQEVDIAEEVGEDEEDIREKPIENYRAEGEMPDKSEAIPDSGLEKAQKKEAATMDPMPNLSDDDLEE